MILPARFGAGISSYPSYPSFPSYSSYSSLGSRDGRDEKDRPEEWERLERLPLPACVSWLACGSRPRSLDASSWHRLGVEPEAIGTREECPACAGSGIVFRLRPEPPPPLEPAPASDGRARRSCYARVGTPRGRAVPLWTPPRERFSRYCACPCCRRRGRFHIRSVHFLEQRSLLPAFVLSPNHRSHRRQIRNLRPPPLVRTFQKRSHGSKTPVPSSRYEAVTSFRAPMPKRRRTGATSVMMFNSVRPSADIRPS